MNSNTRRLLAIVGVGMALIIPSKVFADANFQQKSLGDSAFLKQLTSEWWQWALSIPTPDNPQIDTTGKNAVVGQRGPVWFLAGIFNGFNGGIAIRKCSVPEGVVLFFPVINAINFNTPNVCGQSSANLSVRDMRMASAATINGASNLSAMIDDVPIRDLRRVPSDVFQVALPDDNVFIPLCGGPGTLPAGVYSPAVADGIYILLRPLRVGSHRLHFHAENLTERIAQDVTYILTVVPVLRN